MTNASRFDACAGREVPWSDLPPDLQAAFRDQVATDGSGPVLQGNEVDGAVSLPLSLQRLLIDLFTPADLRHLAHLKEAASPRLTARQRLDGAGIEMFAEMITTGRIPTVGWWTRHAA